MLLSYAGLELSLDCYHLLIVVLREMLELIVQLNGSKK